MTPSAATIELIGELKREIPDRFIRQARRLGCQYADLRLEVIESQFAWAENGYCKQSGRDDTWAFGIRVIAGDGLLAPGYYGQSLGVADRDRLSRVVRDGLGHAHARAVANARGKSAARIQFPVLAAAFSDTRLAPVSVLQDTVPAIYEMDPRAVPLEEIVSLSREI